MDYVSEFFIKLNFFNLKNYFLFLNYVCFIFWVENSFVFIIDYNSIYGFFKSFVLVKFKDWYIYVRFLN